MTIINSQVEVKAFYAILLDPLAKANSNSVELSDQPQVIIQTPGATATQAAAIFAYQNATVKKKTAAQEKANHLNKAKKTHLARLSDNAWP